MSDNGPHIRFYDNYEPALDDGDYSITVQQTVKSTKVGKGGSALDLAFPAEPKVQKFSVVGPRFTLHRTDIHSVFPPNQHPGIFDQNLAHIVLTKRTLPWERFLQDKNKATPWLAVLLFGPDEIRPPAAASTPKPPPSLAGTYKVSEVVTPTAKDTLGSGVHLDSHDDPDSLCQAIDVPTDVFTRLTPRFTPGATPKKPKVDELRYLAHCRQVDPGDKEILGLKDPGWFSVVIGNRFPTAGDKPEGRLNIAHLVSLEGFADYLVDKPTWPEGKTHVRLVSLWRWTFTCLPEKGDFRDLMLHLIEPTQPPGSNKSLLLRLPAPEKTTGPAQLKVRRALQRGYTALGYHTRVGDDTFAWYRGPLLPAPVERYKGVGPFWSAASAMIYDKENGLFDQSYAVAWQTGRMLALADAKFGADLLAWRRESHRLMNLLLQRINSGTLKTLLGDVDASKDDPKAVAELHKLLEADILSQHYMTYLLGEFSERVAPKLEAPEAPVPDREDVSGLGKNPVAAIKALLELDGVKKLVAEIHGSGKPGDKPSPLTYLVEWLARLRLLYGVPFANLVPDARMLPRESIRFFFVDPNYLDALVDGALSIAVHSSRDTLYQELLGDVIRDAVDETVLVERDKLAGKPVTTPRSTIGGMGGFLLRSAAVSGWPGLEVKGYSGYSGDKPSGPIQLLRMDRLAPPAPGGGAKPQPTDVLLCLFPELPKWIELDEPKEGLAFGHEDDGLVDLRHVSLADIGNVIDGEPVTLDNTYLRDSTKVLQVEPWQKKLQTALGNPGGWGPAEFAIQMVRAPEQMIFKTPQP